MRQAGTFPPQKRVSFAVRSRALPSQHEKVSVRAMHGFAGVDLGSQPVPGENRGS